MATVVPDPARFRKRDAQELLLERGLEPAAGRGPGPVDFPFRLIPIGISIPLAT
jgi:hypothetical protein